MTELQTSEQETETPVEQPLNAPEETVNPEITENPTEEAPQEPSEPVEPTDPDYKQKFVDSQREAILLAERNKVKEAQIEKLTKTDTPTDEAMRLVYPEWDDLNEVTKKALVKQEAQEMRQRAIEARQEELDNRLKQEEEIQSQIQANSKLQGKESEFKRFALNPKNKGISADVLTKAFLFDVEPEAAPVSKTEALPTGSGGPRGDLTPKKMSIEEAAQLRKMDSKRYMELAKAGMIDDDI
jgi:hypothetical protein